MAIKDLIFLKQVKSAPLEWMELIFDTTKEADATNTVAVQLGGIGAGGVTVDWGDGTSQSFTSAEAGTRTHAYPTDGVYTVKIFGDLTRYGRDNVTTNAAKLIEVTRFNGNTKSFASAFRRADNLTAVPSALPVGVTNLSYMFTDASAFNQNISGWDTSSVTDIGNMFARYSSSFMTFNQPIGAWDTSAVVNMERVFLNTNSFNQDVGAWDVSSVTNMDRMFMTSAGTATFNNGGSASINNWNVSAVKFMGSMFNGATAFNQNIGSWNTSAAIYMDSMFASTTLFNQNISSWNTSAVTSMESMFQFATAFNQNIGGWNTSLVTDMDYMFRNAAAFNQNLSSWVTGLTSQPSSFSTSANATFANNANNLKPFLAGGVTRINT